MTDRIDRFKARRHLQAKLREEPTLVALPESADALALLQQSIDSQRVDLAFSALSMDFDTRVSEAEVDAALLDFTNTFNGERFDQLMTDSRREMLQAVVVPFGLGKVLSVYDKAGGNVDTIHNARKEVYATDEARNSYVKIPPMDKALRKTFDRDSRYVDKNRRDTTDQGTGDLRDAYTGEIFGPKQLDKRNLDHTISAAEIHRDRGRDLAGLEALPLANSASNLNPTKERFNKSKGDQKVENLVKRLQREAPARRERIAELQSKSASGLTIKERNELQLSLEKQTIADNPEMILVKDKAARAEYEAKLSDTYYKSKKFKKNVIDTSLKEGGKMAFQQAFGLMLVEFFAATFDELQDFYRNGAAHDRWWPELRSRMERVACRVGSKWKEALAAGGAGFVAGVLSNLITVFLNTLMTTSKRVIRMFREGLMSLLRALKTLAMPPKGMTFREGAHEALKVIGAGAIVIGGVAIEEFIEKFILTIPGLGLIGSVVSAVIIGALTGITSVFLVYLIDRLDPLGVNRSRELKALHEHLDRELDAVMGRNDGLLLRLEATLEC